MSYHTSMKILNKICTVAYELAILGTLLLTILAPIHSASTQHFTVVQTLSDTRAVISGDTSSLQKGTLLDLYRFQYNWKPQLGPATVDSISGNQAQISFDPTKLAWPIGVHGLLTRESDGTYSASIGSKLGAKEGDTLILFKNREASGHVQIEKLGPEKSSLGRPKIDGNPKNFTLSGFTVATQATSFENKTLSGTEISLTLGLLLAYFVIFATYKTSPLQLLGRNLRKISLPRAPIFWLTNLLIGALFVWFMSNMSVNLVTYVIAFAAKYFPALLTNSHALAIAVLPYTYTLIGFAYYTYLFLNKKSPILAFWHFISYNSPAKRGLASNPISFRRGLLNWALHLVVIYAFASILWGFLQGDLHAMNQINPASSREALFEYLKFGLWSLTVIGCLFGYGYSLISILWGKYIRNLDFTVTGWLTNGFCYPLFGVVIWQMIPSFTGLDPIITDGPLELLLLFMGFILNLFYMFTIWNLGTMFDLMADKGVRTWGFYAVVRHPSYTLEVLMFFVTELVGLTGGIQWLAISTYFFLYWIRSEREDNFMTYSNPKFTEYSQETPHKFIPGIY